MKGTELFIAETMRGCRPWIVWGSLVLCIWLSRYTASSAVLGGPVTNAANGHIYYLLSAQSWTNSQKEAVQMGGHLATINNAAENDWVIQQFSRYAGVNRHLWIGLYDANPAVNNGERVTRQAEFAWISGETAAYSNWSPFEPNNAGGAEYHTLIWSPTDPFKGTWNDANGSLVNLFNEPINGLVEIIPAEEPKPEIITTAPEIRTRSTPSKIEQLIGDYDRHRQQATANLTQQRFGLPNTDLGVPFQHNGKTFVAFGDVWLDDRDPLGWSEDENPEDGFSLNFVSTPQGNWKPIVIPGIQQGGFAVPTEGVSIEGTMYLWHTTDSSPGIMGRSVLARSHDEGQSFELLRDFSTTHFINVSAVEQEAGQWPGSPTADGPLLFVFGSGAYRQSDVRLACIPSTQLASTNSSIYFAGLTNGVPMWTSAEAGAIPLFEHPVVGELSVAFDSSLDRWVMLYNSSSPRGIVLRSAINPWGPWSEARVIFEPTRDEGYCHFIHRSWEFPACDQVSDPGRENEWGGEYGPYMFDHLARDVEGARRIYFTLSTWNPYTVVLMKADLVRDAVVAPERPELELHSIDKGALGFRWRAPAHGWFLEHTETLREGTSSRRLSYKPTINGNYIEAKVEARPGFYFLKRP